MQKLDDLIFSYSIPNIVVRHKVTGQIVIFFAVDSDGDTILIGPTDGRNQKGWSDKCWTITKRELLEDFVIA